MSPSEIEPATFRLVAQIFSVKTRVNIVELKYLM